jgi:hypothetical protein
MAHKQTERCVSAENASVSTIRHASMPSDSGAGVMHFRSRRATHAAMQESDPVQERCVIVDVVCVQVDHFDAQVRDPVTEHLRTRALRINNVLPDGQTAGHSAALTSLLHAWICFTRSLNGPQTVAAQVSRHDSSIQTCGPWRCGRRAAQQADPGGVCMGAARLLRATERHDHLHSAHQVLQSSRHAVEPYLASCMHWKTIHTGTCWAVLWPWHTSLSSMFCITQTCVSP